MAKQIYELGWSVIGDSFETLKTEWKVFDTAEEAKAYGTSEQDELNDGLSVEEKAWEGVCFRFQYARPIEDVDGYRVILQSS